MNRVLAAQGKSAANHNEAPHLIPPQIARESYRENQIQQRFYTSWAINGGRLIELRRDWAVVELAENGSQRIFDPRRPDAGNFRLPWIKA